MSGKMRGPIISAMIGLILIAAAVYAATNADRIKQLQDEQRQIVVDIQGMQQQIQGLQNAVVEKQMEFQRAQGAIEELQRQDEEAAKSTEEKGNRKP